LRKNRWKLITDKPEKVEIPPLPLSFSTIEYTRARGDNSLNISPPIFDRIGAESLRDCGPFRTVNLGGHVSLDGGKAHNSGNGKFVAGARAKLTVFVRVGHV
jgi:hypothetical protein